VREVRALNPTAQIIATAELFDDVQRLYEAGANYVVVGRLGEANEFLDAIKAAEAGLLDDKRTLLDTSSQSAAKSFRRRKRRSPLAIRLSWTSPAGYLRVTQATNRQEGTGCSRRSTTSPSSARNTPNSRSSTRRCSA